MKRLTLYAATCAVLLAGCSQPSYSQVSAGGEEFSAIALPALPEKLDFAGEEVPLEYFDVREALQRELLVTSYMHSGTFRTLLNMKRYFSVIEPISNICAWPRVL